MENKVRRFWRITSYTPFCSEERIDYYTGTDENAMHKFAEECAQDNAYEWSDASIYENYDITEDEYLADSDYRFEEISYEAFREECGY